MDNMIRVKTYLAPEVDRKEILRYARVEEASSEITELLEDCLSEIESRLCYKVCYREFEISCEGGLLDLGFARVNSKLLAKNLQGCDRIILFCATVGVEMDRLIQRYSSVSPARSVMLQAIGTERVEALCDEFCDEVMAAQKKSGGRAHPRFSPGYGDLPLDIQRDIFLVLNPSKMIGASLNDSLFMTPSKSVTAIIGVENNN